MSDRTINWGDSEVEAVYQTGDDDPDGGGNFIVARDTDGGVTLLEYDPVAGEWVARDDLNLDGNDLSANAIDAAEVSANDYNDGAIDHDQTGNRTHSGDDLSPNAIDAGSVSAENMFNGADIESPDDGNILEFTGTGSDLRVTEPPRELEILDTFEDTDDDTPVDYDSGSLEEFDYYVVDLISSAAPSADWYLTINNETSNDYDYISVDPDDGSRTKTDDDNKFELFRGGTLSQGRFVLNGDGGTGNEIGFSWDFLSPPINAFLFIEYGMVVASSCDSIQLNTDDDDTEATIIVRGLDT